MLPMILIPPMRFRPKRPAVSLTRASGVPPYVPHFHVPHFRNIVKYVAVLLRIDRRCFAEAGENTGFAYDDIRA